MCVFGKQSSCLSESCCHCGQRSWRIVDKFVISGSLGYQGISVLVVGVDVVVFDVIFVDVVVLGVVGVDVVVIDVSGVDVLVVDIVVVDVIVIDVVVIDVDVIDVAVIDVVVIDVVVIDVVVIDVIVVDVIVVDVIVVDVVVVDVIVVDVVVVDVFVVDLVVHVAVDFFVVDVIVVYDCRCCCPYFLPAQPMLLLYPHSVFLSHTKLILSLADLLQATCCHLPALFPESLITTQFCAVFVVGWLLTHPGL